MMKSKTSSCADYHFLIPQVHTTPINTWGEMARSIPYCLEPGVTRESIRRELARQPHMAQLAKALDEENRVYLIHGSNEEQLELAAQYIGTFHRLGQEADALDWEDCVEEDDESDSDAEDDLQDNSSEDLISNFHFHQELPLIDGYELMQFYGDSGNYFGGMGGFGFRPQERGRRAPWWLRNTSSPLAVRWCGSAGALANIVQSMKTERAFLIFMWKESKETAAYEAMDDDLIGPSFNAEDMAFELETPALRIEDPQTDSPYKQQVLCQLARQRGSSIARGKSAAAVLHLVEDYRGNVDNHTLSKAISNALLRRKGTGPLGVKDFEYLSTFRAAKQKAPGPDGRRTMVGQKEVERQLRQIVDTLAFQKKRQQLGLGGDPIHCTFAFLGAPGTGKTTWAMRLAREMEKLGLLENTESICMNAAELKAKYVGHTTGRVKALFDQYGVIILDEAYSLTDGGDADCFTQEALAQLCVELEKHASDRLVIFAGYGGSGDPRSDRMLRFLQCNPGISSRVAFKIRFENFQPPELVQVFRAMLGDSGYQVPPESDGAVENFFRRLQTSREDFGNCREARNLADRVKVHMSARLAGKTGLTRKEACTVLPEDIAAATEDILGEERMLRRSAPSIGF